MLADIANDVENSRRAAALRALALIQDANPDVAPEMEGSTRRRMRRELARIRLRRDLPMIRRITTAGAAGGAFGLGLGLSIPLALHMASYLEARSRTSFLLGQSLRFSVFPLVGSLLLG